MHELEEKLEKALPDIARRFWNELVLVCPVDKGFLKNSIKVKVIDGVLVVWMNETGKWVEFGTPPHVITPKDKKALKFKGEDGDIIVKKVRHPGTRPNPFIRNTIQNKLRNIIIEEVLKQ